MQNSLRTKSYKQQPSRFRSEVAYRFLKSRSGSSVEQTLSVPARQSLFFQCLQTKNECLLQCELQSCVNYKAPYKIRNLSVSNIAEVKLGNLGFLLALNSVNRPGKTALPKHSSIWHSSAEKHSRTDTEKTGQINKTSYQRNNVFRVRHEGRNYVADKSNKQLIACIFMYIIKQREVAQ